MQEDEALIPPPNEHNLHTSHNHHHHQTTPNSYYIGSNSSATATQSPVASYFWQGPLNSTHSSSNHQVPPQHAHYWPSPSPYPTPAPPSQGTSSPFPRHAANPPGATVMGYGPTVMHVTSPRGPPPSYHSKQPASIIEGRQDHRHSISQSPAVPDYISLPPIPSSTSSQQHSHHTSATTPSNQATIRQQEVIDLLQSLDLLEYLDPLLQNGFDSLSALNDIQEDDFEYLGVKRGHRRLLRRELASMRGVPKDIPLTLVGQELPVGASEEESENVTNGRGPISQINRNTFYLTAPSPRARSDSTNSHSASASGETTKRRYRRHPKVDPHAPVKPASAYVEFSNTVREEMKGASFTEIARRVGERWQALSKQEKECLENQAAVDKEAYLQALSEYRKTPEHAAYQQYLLDFKRKYPSAVLPDHSSATAASAAAAAAAAAASLPTPSSASTTPNPFATYAADRGSRQDVQGSHHNVEMPEGSHQDLSESPRHSKRLRAASGLALPPPSFLPDLSHATDDDASAAAAAAMVLAGSGPWLTTDSTHIHKQDTAKTADSPNNLTVGDVLQTVGVSRQQGHSAGDARWHELSEHI